MKSLNRIVVACQSLFRLARRPADAAALIAAAERELDVERMGYAEGIANRPGPDATDDANEARIGGRMRKIGADLRREHEQRLHDLMERCAQLAAKFSPAFVTGLVDEAQDRLQALDARKRLELHEARRREREAQRELAAFRDANRLTRSARPAKPLWAVLLFAAVAAMAEGGINTWAFSGGAAGGWREAIFTSTLVASANIAAGLAAGAAAGNLVHVRRWRKFAGVVTTLLYGAFALEFTALTARYRSALVFDPDNAAHLAAEHIGQLAFGASDFQTLLLIIASIGFAALSFATGLFASDIYPGFSRVAAHWSSRRASLLAARRSVGGEAEELTGELLNEVDERVQQAAQARSQFASTVKQARDVVSEHDHAVRLVNSAHDGLVQRYRRALLVVRDRGLPLPAYMAEPPRAVVHAAASGAAGGTINSRALEAAEATLSSLANVELALRAAADKAKSAIYGLRAAHAARRDTFFAAAEDMPPPPKPVAEELPVAERAGRNGQAAPIGASDGLAQELTH